MKRGSADYVLRKIAYALITIFAATTLNFFLTQAVPGGASAALARQNPRLTQADIQEQVQAFGLDDPLLVQYGHYLNQVFLHGNLGLSIYNGQPVTPQILDALKHTIPMVGLGSLFAIIFGTLTGVIAASRRRTFLDYGTTNTALVLYSLPDQWLGLMLIIVFGGLLPAGGMINEFANPQGFAFILDSLQHMILPAMTLGLVLYGEFTITARSSMLESLGEDYILTARAKGVPRKRIIWRHAFRNATLPIVTITALTLGYIAAGAILVEEVFSWPGIGKLEFDSIQNRDWPMALGAFLVLTIVVIFFNLVTDLLYLRLDPRITE